jgi:hypothetical protein
MVLVSTKRDIRELSPALSSTLWVYHERQAVCEPGTEPLSATKPTGNLILDFSVSRTVRINFYCLSYLVCGILIWQSPRRDTYGTLYFHLQSYEHLSMYSLFYDMILMALNYGKI